MITITAATGRYGRLVVEALPRRGVPANEIVAAVRSPEKAADLAARGVQVREADYDRPETLASAFAGADKILLIPSADFGQRYPQMVPAVEAAIDAVSISSPMRASSTPTSARSCSAKRTNRRKPSSASPACRT